jgi:hypothetical protein
MIVQITNSSGIPELFILEFQGEIVGEKFGDLGTIHFKQVSFNFHELFEHLHSLL